MTHFRKGLYIHFSFVVLAALGLVVGSMDSSGYDDFGLLDQIKDVPDSENGYSKIAYTQAEDFQLFDDGDHTEMLRQYVYQEAWNEGFVTHKIVEGARHMDSAISFLSYSYLKFPTSRDVGEMLSYLPIMSMARLIIIKSMYDAKSGKLDEAIRYAEHAVILSQKIKTESNHWLISHMIGLVMQYEALVWINHLAIDYELSKAQYKQLMAIFETIPSYHQDSFPQVFSGEFVFMQSIIDMIIDRPFKKKVARILGERRLVEY
ncbi:MAG: hypothetical protein ABW168_03725 [Sedimenticola sp.]